MWDQTPSTFKSWMPIQEPAQHLQLITRLNCALLNSTIKNWMEDIQLKEKLAYKIINEKLCIQNLSEIELNDIGIVFPDGRVKFVNFAAHQWIELN